MRLARVPGHLLRHRLDGAYYDPSALELDARLRQLGNARRLESLRDPERPITNGVRGPELIDSSFRLIRLQDCIDWEVRADLALSISGKQFSENARCRLRRDDVVVAIGGYVGNAAIVIDDTAAVIGQHSARVSLAAGGPMNPRFLLAYLNSEPGRVQFARLMRGTVQQGLNLEDVQEIEVPVFSSQVQRYIGDKVRQAERLRERARTLELAAHIATIEMVRHRSNAQDAVRNLLLVISGKQAARLDPVDRSSRRVGALSSRVAPSAMFGRLNAEAYKQEFLDNDRLLRASEWPLTRLGDLVVAPINNSIRGVTEHLSPDGRGVPMFRPADIDGLWMNDASAPRISAAFEQEHAKARVQPGDIVLAIAGTVAAVARIGESVMHGNINGSSARVRLQTPRRGFALLFLASPFGQRELMRWAVGSVQKHLNLEDLTEVRIPELPVELCEPFESSLQLSGRSRDGSKGLLAAATTLVEQLIEGRVTEADLVAAQKALEAGDRSADRELLKALRQSDALDAKPLIADVDALYALLDESEDAP